MAVNTQDKAVPGQEQQHPSPIGRSGEGSASVLEHLLRQERAKAADGPSPDRPPEKPPARE